MGRLFYVFVHLVQQYCKTSDIPGKQFWIYNNKCLGICWFLDQEMKQFYLCTETRKGARHVRVFFLYIKQMLFLFKNELKKNKNK
jgi:ferric iron reductase protein FhuF